MKLSLSVRFFVLDTYEVVLCGGVDRDVDGAKEALASMTSCWKISSLAMEWGEARSVSRVILHWAFAAEARSSRSASILEIGIE